MHIPVEVWAAPRKLDSTPQPSDGQLLEEFNRSQSQEAFAALARRHVDFVYSCAVRQVRDRHLAEDVTQAVFLLLSRKAGTLGADCVLPGWLFRTTRYVALNARKSANRRRHHEHIGATMTNPIDTASDPTPDTQQPDWEKVSPYLDEALAALRDTDRDAVLLRFFSGKSHREVGDAIGLSADAAKKRVDRALDKLRAYFSRKGVAVSAVALAGTLTSRGVEAAPAHVATASATVLTAAPAAGVVGLTHMAAGGVVAKVVAAVLAVAVVGGGTTAVVIQARQKPAALQQTQAKPVRNVNAPPVAPAPPPVVDIAAVIRSPNETPAAGAEIYLVTPKSESVDVRSASWPTGTRIADERGRFSIEGAQEPWVMVVRHPSGYAQVTPEQFKSGKGELWLQPWGRIEGRLLVGREPKAGWSVHMGAWHPVEQWDLFRIRIDSVTTTDAEGRFVFDNVPPGDVWLTHSNGEKPLPGGQILHNRKFTLVEVAAGKPTQAQVGGLGRPVIGRLPETVAGEGGDPPMELTWINDRTRDVEGRFSRSDLPNPPQDKDWEAITPQERGRRYFAWLKTPEGRYRHRYGWNEEFDINPDGTFRIDDVLPGKYQAHFDYQVREGPRGQLGPSLISAFVNFEVKEMPRGRSDEPLDVGLVPVKLRPRLYEGKPAPDFAARTRDGKALKLSDHKGKFVVLKFWWNWDKMEEADKVKRAWEAVKDDSDFVLVNVSFEDTPEVYKKSLDATLPGIHAVATHQEFPQAYTAWPFDVCVIDAEGLVLKRDVRLEQLRATLAQIALERK